MSKVYLDLKKTPIKTLNKGLIFYFSSEFYKKKFIENVNKYIHEENLKLKNKYKISNICDLFLAVSYYKKVEKRGFRVYDSVNKKEITAKTIFGNYIISY